MIHLLPFTQKYAGEEASKLIARISIVDYLHWYFAQNGIDSSMERVVQTKNRELAAKLDEGDIVSRIKGLEQGPFFGLYRVASPIEVISNGNLNVKANPLTEYIWTKKGIYPAEKPQKVYSFSPNNLLVSPKLALRLFERL